MGLLKNNEEKLIDSLKDKNIKKVKSILKNSNKNEKKLNLNKKHKNGQYPFLWAIFNDNVEMIKLLIEYANRMKKK